VAGDGRSLDGSCYRLQASAASSMAPVTGCRRRPLPPWLLSQVPGDGRSLDGSCHRLCKICSIFDG
ncbi:hypothetical protein CYMTET_50744, partial [Cymbomonas tetramitiformis]